AGAVEYVEFVEMAAGGEIDPPVEADEAVLEPGTAIGLMGDRVELFADVAALVEVHDIAGVAGVVASNEEEPARAVVLVEIRRNAGVVLDQVAEISRNCRRRAAGREHEEVVTARVERIGIEDECAGVDDESTVLADIEWPKRVAARAYVDRRVAAGI